jgi:hypothetical protein
MVHMVLKSPSSIIGFRPYLSDAAPHKSPVNAWHIEKTADVMPAQRAMSFSGTPKDSIISGTYGNTEVSAIGSANRHIAGGEVSKLLKHRPRSKKYRVLSVA